MGSDLLQSASAIFGIVGFLYGAYKEYFNKDSQAQVLQLQSEVIILERKIAKLGNLDKSSNSIVTDLIESPSLEMAKAKHLMHAFDRFQKPIFRYTVIACVLFSIALLISGVNEPGGWTILSTLTISFLGWLIYRFGRIILLTKITSTLKDLKLTDKSGAKLKIWINNEPWLLFNSSTILARKVNNIMGL